MTVDKILNDSEILNGVVQNQDKVMMFEELLLSVNRNGIDKVVEFIRNSDFYTAPASSNYHSNYKGGLLDHSLVVYNLCDNYSKAMVSFKPEISEQLNSDSIKIVSLLHDICKTYFYEDAKKWKKDDNSQWYSYDGYNINDLFPIGHGEKSVIMLQKIGLDMNASEMLAIRYHMGFWGNEGNGDLKFSQTKALKMSPLVLLLQMADFSASTIFEYEIK